MQATIASLIHLSALSVLARAEADEGASESAETPDPEVVLAATKKALHWLYCLGRSDEAARRAFLLCNSCIHRIAPSNGLDLSDMPPNIDSSETPSAAHYPEKRDIPRETSNPTLQRDQGSDNPKSPKLMAYQGFVDHKESEDKLFQDAKEAASRESVRSLSAVLDTDVAMSEWIPDPTAANFEDLLLLMIGPNV